MQSARQLEALWGVLRGTTRADSSTADTHIVGTATVRRVPLAARQRPTMAYGQQDVHALLWDIFHFLSENLSGEMLSDTADNERKTLLDKLSCVFPELPSTYLAMNGKSHCDEEYIFSDVSENRKDQNASQKNCNDKYSNVSDSFDEITFKHPNLEHTSPQLNIGYKELCAKAEKYGPLLRRERYFFLEQYRRCWAGLMDQTLLVYTSERDTKPVFTLNVKGFSARPATNVLMKDPKKKNLCFEVVCPGQKTYQFTARTAKDMDQWVAAICEASGYELCLNQQKQHQPVRKLPSIPHENVQEDYDDINALQEEIYHDILDIRTGGLMEDKNAPAICNLLSELNVSEHQENDACVENEEEEDIYDDVNSFLAVSADSNLPQTLSAETESSVSQEASPDNIRETCEDDLQLYDDIEPKSTSSKQVNSSTRGINFSTIDKSLRDQIMASVYKMQKHPFPAKVEIIHSLKAETSEELYESIDTPNSQ